MVSQGVLVINTCLLFRSDLLISVLFSKYKADKPRVRTQDKTLADIEEENTDIAGLSFSTTTKILADANKIYKTMKNIKK